MSRRYLQASLRGKRLTLPQPTANSTSRRCLRQFSAGSAALLSSKLREKPSATAS
jgi:hypothetical protein